MENFKHHSSNQAIKDFEKDIQSIYNEEVIYFKNSEVYVARNFLGNMVGSIRILKWNFTDILPIQKVFGINPNSSNNNIYHIGRFAIKKEVGDVNLFKKLMVCAITPVCKRKENIAYAECDSKLFEDIIFIRY